MKVIFNKDELWRVRKSFPKETTIKNLNLVKPMMSFQAESPFCKIGPGHPCLRIERSPICLEYTE